MTRTGFVIASLLVLAGSSASRPWSDFTYFTTAEISPEGFPVIWSGPAEYHGRIHTNGNLFWSTTSPPTFTGFVTQTPPFSDHQNLEDVFQSAFSDQYASVEWPPAVDLQELEQLCEPLHRWEGTANGELLTTLIRFNGNQYNAAQYAETELDNGDTLWHVPWASYPLPQEPGQAPLIHIAGVGRVKGVVAGRLTLACADSLFIMGDLITVDTDTTSVYSQPELFGTKPMGSPHAIGLIGGGDVLIAATLENGFGNGPSQAHETCGWENHPVIHGHGHARQDVVVTAAVLAMGCSFGAEFWVTTAYDATPPDPSLQPEPCEGSNHTLVHQYSCPGIFGGQDARGTVWLCGSFASGLRGYVVRNPLGAWGVNIGYYYRRLRADRALSHNPPPFWPEIQWMGESINHFDMELAFLNEANTDCGMIADTSTFLDGWSDGSLQLEASHSWPDSLPIPLELALYVDGIPREQASVWLPPTVERLTLPFDPGPHMEEGSTLWISAECESFVWNEDGEECSWLIDTNTELTFAKHPAGFTLHPPFPNPFNPVTQVELELSSPTDIRITVHDLQGRLVSVIHDGTTPAGVSHISVDGSAWPSGIYLLHVEGAGVRAARKLVLLK